VGDTSKVVIPSLDQLIEQIEKLPLEYAPSAASPFISRDAVMKILRPGPTFRKFDNDKMTVETWLEQFDAGSTVEEVLALCAENGN
jgi:hypothetical protein